MIICYINNRKQILLLAEIEALSHRAKETHQAQESEEQRKTQGAWVLLHFRVSQHISCTVCMYVCVCMCVYVCVCMHATKQLLFPFSFKSCHTRKRILGNLVQPCQTDTSQSPCHRLLLWFFFLFSFLPFEEINIKMIDFQKFLS